MLVFGVTLKIIFFQFVKKKNVKLLAEKWIQLEINILNELSQFQKDK